MKKCIGIRHEDKYQMERRTPLVPKHISTIVQSGDIIIQVQKSAKRIFSDLEYTKAGAKIVDNMKDCNIIFGVKEIPEDFEPLSLLPGWLHKR